MLYILKDTLEVEKQKEIVKLLEKGEKGKMDEWLESIRRNDAKIKMNWMKDGMKKGRKQGITAILKNMLENKVDIESIMKYTNVEKEEIEKIKKEMAN